LRAAGPEVRVSRLSRLGFIDVRRTTSPVRRRVRSRGIPPALADREIFYSEDVQETADLLGKALSPAALTLGEVGAQGFAASLHGVRLRDVSMLYVDLTVAATLDMPVLGPYFAVHMPTNGRAVCRQDGREFEANPIRAVVTSPGTSLTMRFDHDSPQLVIRFEQEALVRYLTRVLGRSLGRPVVFEPELDLTAEAATRWHGAVQLLHTEVFYPGSLVQRGQGIGAVEELLMSSLLLLQPSNHHAQLVQPVEPAGRRVVREAMDYLERRLCERVTMADLARHTHTSIRTIQQGFRDELGTTPMLYLRERRLERAREDLTRRRGHRHRGGRALGVHAPGQLRGALPPALGESPSQTLRR